MCQGSRIISIDCVKKLRVIKAALKNIFAPCTAVNSWVIFATPTSTLYAHLDHKESLGDPIANLNDDLVQRYLSV